MKKLKFILPILFLFAGSVQGFAQANLDPNGPRVISGEAELALIDDAQVIHRVASQMDGKLASLDALSTSGNGNGVQNQMNNRLSDIHMDASTLSVTGGDMQLQSVINRIITLQIRNLNAEIADMQASLAMLDRAVASGNTGGINTTTVYLREKMKTLKKLSMDIRAEVRN